MVITKVAVYCPGTFAQVTITLEAVEVAGVAGPEKLQLYVAPAIGGAAWNCAPSRAQRCNGPAIPDTISAFWVIVLDKIALQPLPSVTVTVYVPAANPDGSCPLNVPTLDDQV